ncbi:MAG TPA: family 78 glycoside hydrolase catalytic domain [Pseudomonadales bacterium]|nr:family 78 glycoside hydrolase catalytic domain [Pseudomonadales bacterium]
MNKPAQRIIIYGLLAAIAVALYSLYLANRAQETSWQARLTPVDLRCNSLKNPTGLDDPRPVLSWILNSTGRGHEQAAYEILVASSRQNLAANKGDLWDSGRLNSGQSIQVPYAGKPLASSAFYFWKVRIWDTKGASSEWSEPAFWTMGLLEATNWTAKWIGLDGESTTNKFRPLPARWLRKEFALPDNVRRATVYFSGLGWSELYINGQKIGDYVLSPPLSEYHRRDYYETYEVGRLLKSGTNAIGVVLGNGRFYAPRTNAFNSGFPKLLLELDIEFADGTTTTLISDESWKLTTNGPIVANNDYDGEDYDARKEFPGWSSAGFNDSTWQSAQVVSPPGGELSGIRQNPMRITGEIKPVTMKELKPGVYVFDMGQNMVGWCRLKVQGPAGTEVGMRFAETLDDSGELYTNNLRTARATDIYTLKGQGQEVWEPRFTLHGFRYVELTGYPGKPSLDTLTGCVVNDDMPMTGSFECSNPLLNQIYHNIVWGVRGNYRSIPTDCPQRDERQGWLGDRAEESRGETYFFDNDALYSKWLVDITDAQRTNGTFSDVSPAYWHNYRDNVTWPSASIMIPAMLRDQFGDTQAIAEHYDSAKKWIEHMETFVTNGIITKDNYGDWCMPPEDPRIIHSHDTNRITHPALLATPFFYHDLKLMQDYALQLGKTNDAEDFGNAATQIRVAFNTQYLNRETGQYDNGTPTSSVLPLAFDMVPDDMHQKVFDYLVNKLTNDWHSHIGTGLVGAKYLMRVLSDNGRPDLAYTIVTQTNYPSWGYMADHGATTTWELWNGDTADPSMNSGNHVMLIGDVGIWLYENLAGIMPDPEQPGFKHILMQPTPVADLTWVKASHLSPYGWISSQWQKNGNEFQWQIKIPTGTTATIYLPAATAADITESGQPLANAIGVKLLGTNNGKVVADIESGSYNFACKTGQ